MGVIRIPVALKFDDESDFFKSFIEPKRESKELSSFIVNVLKAYYEDEAVKHTVNEVLDENSPFVEIQKHLQRIHLEHSKILVSNDMLAKHLEATEEEINNGSSSEVTGEQPQSQTVLAIGESTSEPEVLKRLGDLEKLVPSIDEKLNSLISILHNGIQNQTVAVNNNTPVQESVTPTPSPTISQTTQTVQSSVEPTVVIPNQNDTISQTQENVAPNSQGVTVESPVAPTIAEIPVVEGQPTTAPTVALATEEEEQAKPVKRRPASFGKALKSTKKD